MRPVLISAVLALTITCTATRGESENVEMSTIASGSYAVDESGRKAVLATTNDDYRRLWTELIGEGDAPQVDLTNGAVVFLLGGSKPTGGWSVAPKSVTVASDGTAIVDANVEGPPVGSMVTQAFTSPYAVILVQNAKPKRVRWDE